MKKYKILIDTIEKIKKFNTESNKVSFNIDIISGKYIINAKSIMALFSLDTSNFLYISIDLSKLNKIELEEFNIYINKINDLIVY